MPVPVVGYGPDGGMLMGAYLEVWDADRPGAGGPGGRAADPRRRPRQRPPLPTDPTLSRLHAALERYEAGWCVRDLDSRNGTFVNGQRIWRERPLRPGDELRVGATRLIFAEALYRFDQTAVERRPVRASATPT